MQKYCVQTLEIHISEKLPYDRWLKDVKEPFDQNLLDDPC
jgi:hypothetical protein